MCSLFLVKILEVVACVQYHTFVLYRYAYMPFGQGPRSCLGMRFALLEAKLGLASIVRKFNLLPSPKTTEPLQYDPVSGIAYVKGGLHIKAEKIN